LCLPFKFPDLNIIAISILSTACYMPYLSHPPRFDYPNNIWKAYKLWSSSSFNFMEPSVVSSPFGSNIFLSTNL
jgi:hypothetical protein